MTAGAQTTTTEVYDDFSAPGGYSLEHYAAKWANPFGLGEMDGADNRRFDADGLHLTAIPFRTSSDESVFDHLKYMALSTTTFPVPEVGSVRFTATITATTPGTDSGRVVHGSYLATGAPYAESTLEGQQAGAVLNIVDFATGQLFDWFVAGSTAFALIERLPSTVTANTTDPASSEWVGADKMYTQIIAEFPIAAGPHEVSIRFTRDAESGHAEWFLDGAHVARVDRVGIPLDAQGVPFTGTYPALGAGEDIGARIASLSMGHGLFSLVDAFPFQYADVPELAVTIPPEERVWGQGIEATFADFRVETSTAS